MDYIEKLKCLHYMITDTDTLLVSEEGMEKIAPKIGYDIYDDENCIDATAVGECASDLGFLNLGDFGNSYVFAINWDLVPDYVIEQFFTFNGGTI